MWLFTYSPNQRKNAPDFSKNGLQFASQWGSQGKKEMPNHLQQNTNVRVSEHTIIFFESAKHFV